MGIKPRTFFLDENNNMKPLFKSYNRTKFRDFMRHDLMTVQLLSTDGFWSEFRHKSDVEFAKGVVRRKWGLSHFAFKKVLKAKPVVYPFPLV